MRKRVETILPPNTESKLGILTEMPSKGNQFSPLRRKYPELEGLLASTPPRQTYIFKVISPQINEKSNDSL